MTLDDLIEQLEKLPHDAEVKVHIRLTNTYELKAKQVGYRPDTNEVVISND